MAVCPPAIWPPVVVPADQSQHRPGRCGIVARLSLPRSLMPNSWEPVLPEFKSCLASAGKTLAALARGPAVGAPPPPELPLPSIPQKPRGTRRFSSAEHGGLALPSPLNHISAPTSPSHPSHSAVTPVARLPASPMPGALLCS